MGVLFSEDCLEVLPCVSTESIDMVFADPPFNLGKDYGNGKDADSLSDSAYLNWSYAWIDECIRLLKPGGSFFIYILPKWGFRFCVFLEDRGLSFRHWIALSMKGTFPRGKKLYPAHYALLYFTKGPPQTFNKVRVPIPTCRHCGKDIKDYGGHRKYLHPDGLNLTDLWEDTSPARHSKFKTRWGVNELKPVIPARCIEIATVPGDIVLDPFGGGGSTYEAAQRLDRYWLGTEISTASGIIDRLSAAFPESLKVSPPETLTNLVTWNVDASSSRRKVV